MPFHFILAATKPWAFLPPLKPAVYQVVIGRTEAPLTADGIVAPQRMTAMGTFDPRALGDDRLAVRLLLGRLADSRSEAQTVEADPLQKSRWLPLRTAIVSVYDHRVMRGPASWAK